MPYMPTPFGGGVPGGSSTVPVQSPSLKAELNRMPAVLQSLPWVGLLQNVQWAGLPAVKRGSDVSRSVEVRGDHLLDGLPRVCLTTLRVSCNLTGCVAPVR